MASANTTFAERRRSATDRRRRRTVVGLTEAGRELLARADELSDRVEDVLSGGFTAEERDQLRAPRPGRREHLDGVRRPGMSAPRLSR